jgi:hypothetical protein
MIIKFPSKEIQDSDEGGEAVTPSVGDMVEVPAVTGIVQDDKDGMLTVKIRMIGKHECGDEEDGAESEDGVPDEKAMRDIVEKADAEGMED